MTCSRPTCWAHALSCPGATAGAGGGRRSDPRGAEQRGTFKRIEAPGVQRPRRHPFLQLWSLVTILGDPGKPCPVPLFREAAGRRPAAHSAASGAAWRQPFPRDTTAAIPRFTRIATGQQEARGAQASGWRERTQQRRSSVRDCKSISATVKKPDDRGTFPALLICK